MIEVQTATTNQEWMYPKKNFEGAEPEIGCTIGLKHYRVDKKSTFEIFRDNICNCIERKI